MLKVLAVAVAIAATTTVAGAQGTTTYKSAAKPATQTSTTAKRHHKSVKKAETQAELQKEAKISEETARLIEAAAKPDDANSGLAALGGLLANRHLGDAGCKIDVLIRPSLQS